MLAAPLSCHKSKQEGDTGAVKNGAPRDGGAPGWMRCCGGVYWYSVQPVAAAAPTMLNT